MSELETESKSDEAGESSYILREINYGGTETQQAVMRCGAMIYAELGCNFGHTAAKVAKILPPNSEMHLFDYDDYIEKTRETLAGAGRPDISFFFYSNSSKERDSYCWSLINLLARAVRIFDYVYIDGSHDLTVDGFSFFLADKLLKLNGHIEFDDYDWTFAASPTIRPELHPPTAQWYTAEQLQTPQVKLIVESLVRTDDRYVEVIRNRLFKKIR